jgi:hypothetical protein
MHSAASCCSPSRLASLRRRFELRRRGPEPAPFVVIASDFCKSALAFRQPFEIYTVHLSETGNLMVFELQDRLDLLVRKVARCCYVPDALPHRLFQLASTIVTPLDMTDVRSFGELRRVRGYNQGLHSFTRQKVTGYNSLTGTALVAPRPPVLLPSTSGCAWISPGLGESITCEFWESWRCAPR